MAAGACLAVTALMRRQPARRKWYLGGEAGWTTLEDQTDKISGVRAGHKRFDEGYAAGARGGYQMGPWRFEEEYIYRNNELSRPRVGGVNIPGVSGGRSSHAIMTNVLYDFNNSAGR